MKVRWPRRLSTRLSLSLTALFFVTFVSVALFAVYNVNRIYERSVDSNLLGIAHTVDERLASPEDTPTGVVDDLSTAAVSIELIGATGSRIAYSAPLATHPLWAPRSLNPAPPDHEVFRTSRFNKSSMRVLVMPSQHAEDGVAAIAVSSLAPEFQDSIARLLLIVGGAGLLGLLITVGGTLWLSRRSTRALQQLAGNVSAAAAAGFEGELATPAGGGLEVEQLSTALHDLVRRQHDYLRRERAFFADSSHVLRTPLAIIRGNTELLERDADTPERTEALQAISRAGETMARTLDGLLLLSREDSSSTATWEAFSLSDLLQVLAGETRILNAGARVVTDIEPNLDMAGDPRQIRNLLFAVIENAAHYIPGEGTIEIVAHRREDDRAEVAVLDDGIGITPDEAAVATERFRRGLRARRLNPPGSGLGLAIASRIARLHGGNLAIAPRQPRGTAVRIVLPLLG